MEMLSDDQTYFVMEDGETILPYDACSRTLNYYDPKYFSYIGRGVICMVDGIPQDFSLDNPDHVWYFYGKR